jgi:hypothetical protein
MIGSGGFMVRLLVLALLSFPCSLSVAAVASLASLEGEVSVLRAGVLIPSEKLADGFPLEAFDTISTGNSGRADIRFVPSTGLDGVVRLDPQTALYLDVTPWKQEQTAGIELLAGSVEVLLSAVIGASLVEVRTEVGTFGGSGPRFRVVDTPEGDVLALSEAGPLICRVGGRIMTSDPGAMLEVLTLDRSVRTISVNVSTLDSAVGAWLSGRKQGFRDQVETYFRILATRYQNQGGRFQRAWERIKEDAKADPGGNQAAIANLRRSAFPLERSIFRIESLRELLDEGVLSPAVELTRGYTAKDFFDQAARDSRVFSTRLGQARLLYRVLADHNGGDFPRASEGSAVTWGSDFFN